MRREEYNSLKSEILVIPTQELKSFQDKYQKDIIVDFVTYSVEKDKEYLEKDNTYISKLFELIRGVVINDYYLPENSKENTIKSSFKNTVLDSYSTLMDSV